MFSKGDLLKFNSHGTELFRFVTGSIGIVASSGKVLYEYDYYGMDEPTQYIVYDIIVCGQLYNDIPKEFLDRITQDEKNIE